MIHGADKSLLPSLFVLAAAATLTVAVLLVLTVLVREFLFLSRLLVLASLGVCLGRIGLAFGALPSATPPAMPLGLALRRLPLRRLCLGLVLLCCHACTSWCVDLIAAKTPAESRCHFLLIGFTGDIS